MNEALQIPVIIFFIIFIFMIDIIRDHWTTTKNIQYLLLMGINKINIKSVGQLPRLSKFQTVCFVLLHLLVIQICNKTCTPLALCTNRENDFNLIITSLVFLYFCTPFLMKSILLYNNQVIRYELLTLSRIHNII